MPSLRYALLTVLLPGMLIAGCSGAMSNTLAQDLAWERWNKCKDADPEMQLREIRPDGQIWVSHAGPIAATRDCLRRAAAEQAARGVTAVSPVVVTPPRQPAARAAVTAGEPASPAVPPDLASVPPPVWRVRDEWAYRYSGPSDSGTYVWSVDRGETVDGVECYVVKTGTREIFYRRPDLASVVERVGGVVVRQHIPPREHYSWPLFVGKIWEQSVAEERPADRQRTESVRRWTVEQEETIAVPAGSFRTLKIVEKNKATGATRIEMWYAPVVNQWVKLREFMDAGLRERELIAFRVAQPSVWLDRPKAAPSTTAAAVASPPAAKAEPVAPPAAKIEPGRPAWIIGVWEVEVRGPAAAQGSPRFVFVQDGTTIRWTMVRGRQPPGGSGAASGTVRTVSESWVEMIGSYLSGQATGFSFSRAGNRLEGYETGSTASMVPGSLSLRKVE